MQFSKKPYNEKSNVQDLGKQNVTGNNTYIK